MKAAICEKFGPPEVLRLTEIEKPEPKDDEILIKVRATTVNGADCNIRGLTQIPPGLGILAKLMLGFKGPKIPVMGSVVAGEVEKTGENGKSFQFDEIVEAHRYVESGSKRGNIAVTIN